MPGGWLCQDLLPLQLAGLPLTVIHGRRCMLSDRPIHGVNALFCCFRRRREDDAKRPYREDDRRDSGRRRERDML